MKKAQEMNEGDKKNDLAIERNGKSAKSIAIIVY